MSGAAEKLVILSCPKFNDRVSVEGCLERQAAFQGVGDLECSECVHGKRD